MNLRYGMSINEIGHLEIGGCDAVELKGQFGTPLYVMDEEYIRKNCREVIAAVRKYFPNGKVMFASKALNNKAILKIVTSEGLGVDTVSGGELFTALSSGIAPSKIELHGNSKSRDEIMAAIENDIGCIIADGFDELDLIESVAAELNKKVNVTIRIRPNIDIHAHSAVQTARMDCKFGFGLSDGQALDAARIISQSRLMRLYGIHCHIGSQIFEIEPFASLCVHLVDFAKEIRQATGETVTEFNLGGGFGVKYTEEDDPKPVEAFIKLIYDKLTELSNEKSYPMPNITVEPGRFIVGEAGTTLYNVNGIKEIEGIRTYCMCDGGMYENVRKAMYDAKYEAVCANKMNEKHEKLVAIAGKCCESGDMITYDTPMPRLNVGDTLAVLTTGAYNYSMASNYNRNPIPAMVLVKTGKASLIVKRQSYEDITSNDIIPDYLL